MYRARHAGRTGLARRIAGAVLAVGLAGTATTLATGAAFADPAGVGVVQNTAGEAGYFANDNGQTRFRDVQADLVVTNQLKNLNGESATSVGAAGVELCDPNSGRAAQLGVYWDKSTTPNRFRVAYATGSFSTATVDPCIQSGLVNPVPTNFLLDLLTISAGDHLHFEIYWQPTGHTHFFTFKVCDVTQDVCRQAHVGTGFLNLYEAGVGVVTQQNTLTAPAINSLVNFSGTKFNYYSSTKAWNSINVPSHWQLKRSDFVNGSDQVVMSSDGGLNGAGTAFPMFNGSTSA